MMKRGKVIFIHQSGENDLGARISRNFPENAEYYYAMHFYFAHTDLRLVLWKFELGVEYLNNI